MGGKAGTGRRLWLSRDADGRTELWATKPAWHEDGQFWDAPANYLRVDEFLVGTVAGLYPGECIELREVRRVKGGRVMGGKPRAKPGVVLWAARDSAGGGVSLWGEELKRDRGYLWGGGYVGRLFGLRDLDAAPTPGKPRRVRIHVELLEDDDADAT